MKKTILLTGATDGIGLETAKLLADSGNDLLIHGRNKEKLDNTLNIIKTINPRISVKAYISDLSQPSEVERMANEILKDNSEIDVIINNAGIFMTPQGLASNGIDIRFMVNTISPYLLSRMLLPILAEKGRIINLSSAAQAPINWEAFTNGGELDPSSAYAQSKLAITMWSIELAKELGEKAVIISVNPKSFLGSKMVKDAYGHPGYDLKIGADILCRAALSEEFASKSGLYFDNDSGRFDEPHPFALLEENRKKLMDLLNKKEV